jgi:hypothetical protein
MGVPKVSTECREDMEFVFDRFGLLNSHSNDGRILVTWVSIFNYVVLGQKPTDPMEYLQNIHIPSGWVTLINQALLKKVVEVVCKEINNGKGPIRKLVGIKADGGEFDLVFSGTNLHFLPPMK